MVECNWLMKYITSPLLITKDVSEAGGAGGGGQIAVI